MPIPQLDSQRLRRVYGEVRSQAAQHVARARARFSWKKFFQIAASAIGVCFIVGTVAVVWISRDLPDPNNLGTRQVAQSTKIYDRTGTHLLYEVYQDEKRTNVKLADISPLIQKATVAVEDKEFYNHKGVRVLSLFRGVFNKLIGRSTGSGGGSTLTQQLVKNTLVGNQRHGFALLFRKVKEMILAVQTENKYSKDQILEMYLNAIPYGSTNYGIESAAQSYFQKSAKDVTLAEAATLSGMVQSPSRYLNNPEALKQRRNVVLKLMADQGYITEDEKKAAQGEELKMNISNGIKAAPHFVLYVKQQLAEQFGEELVDTGGLRVITTLDFDKQVAAEKIVKENGDKFAKDANANNAALVALEPKTAQIVSMVGSRDFYNDSIQGKFNVITLGHLQPGSSLKPFVYTAAFEKGYTPETVLYDVVTDFDARGNDKYTPHDYDGKERGLITMRKALQGSLNIPAVKTLYLVGIQNMIDFSKRFGYSTIDDSCQLTMVLGGCNIIPLEHANAYATLADNGVYHEPVSILKVTDSNGNSLFEWQANEGTAAVSPEMSALITNVLSDNDARAYMFGAQNNLILPDRKVAAKTGTTNDTKAVWTMGYVPSLAVGVWVGNTPTNTPMKGTSNKLAAVIWNQYMRAALASTTPETFPDAPANTSTKPVLNGSDGGIRLSIDTLTGKIASSSTPPNLILEKLFLPPHDILHYVNKDDPRGPAPAHPEDDAQYPLWEAALTRWAERMSASSTPVSFEDPPTEYDAAGDAQTASQLTPTVQVIEPSENAVIRSRTIEFQVNASAPRGVKQVVYYIDNAQVASSYVYPFNSSWNARLLSKGIHTLRVYAVDDVGNSGIKDVQFDMQADFEAPSFEWFGGERVTVSKTDFPYPVYVQPFRWEAVKTIQIYLVSSDNTRRLIYTFDQTDKLMSGQLLSFDWKNFPGPGQYTLHGVLTDTDGRTYEKDLSVVAN